jgi:hypothetical protein
MFRTRLHGEIIGEVSRYSSFFPLEMQISLPKSAKTCRYLDFDTGVKNVELRQSF